MKNGEHKRMSVVTNMHDHAQRFECGHPPTADFDALQLPKLTDFSATPDEIDEIVRSDIHAQFRVRLGRRNENIDYTFLIKAIHDSLSGRGCWACDFDGEVFNVAFGVARNDERARQMLTQVSLEVASALGRGPEDLYDVLFDQVDVAGLLTSLGIRKPALRSVE